MAKIKSEPEKWADKLHKCDLRKSMKCGVREFCIGLVTGLALGIMASKALGMI